MISRRAFVGTLAAGAVVRGADEWTPLFDGRSLTGWKANEHAASWKVVDGMLVAEGARSHLFYTAREFRNFELKAEVMTRPRANSGIYFHTGWIESGWPTGKGFEVQVNNTHIGEGSYREHKKTGSLYGVRNVYKQLVPDDKWFEMHIAVRGPRVEIRVNNILVVDWTEPQNWDGNPVGGGLLALQGHDPGSKVFFRNIRVKELPDQLPAIERPVADDIYREIVRLGAANYPMLDCHVHLKGGLTLDEALENSRRTGIAYGIAVNCGLGFPIHDDKGALDFLASMRGKPVFVALQGEGREWPTLVSKDTISKFDYVFTDSMTWSDDSGKRMRLWIPEEVGDIPDPQHFMDMLVNRAIGILNNEPINIYVNPTYLPDSIAKDYDSLWTPERMDLVIKAAVKNGVAIEINSVRNLPSPAFIRRAKAAGAKFTFGTNNPARALGRLEYGIAMVRECQLEWQDFWVPGESKL